MAQITDLQNCRPVARTSEVARDRDYLTVAEACALFKFSRSGFYRRLRRRGVQLPPHTGQRRFRRADLEPLFVDPLNAVDMFTRGRLHARGGR